MVTITKNPLIQPLLQEPDSLEAWLENPSEGTEWVNEQLAEKSGMTLKHGRAQRRLSTLWANHQAANHLGGEVYTEVPCQTKKQGRRPDVAYITPDLLEQYGEAKVLPTSFPLIAEIVSPTDLAEEMFAKADEYLNSGGQEVWLVYPENYRVIVVTAERDQSFRIGEVARTQRLLPGFSVAIGDLLG